jgi:hypothetical protein
MDQALFCQRLGLCLFRLLSTSIHHLYVIVEYRSDNWDHIGLHHSCADILRASDPNIDHTLECQIPFPHIHHILTPSCLQQAYQSLDAAIDGQDISYPGGGGREVCEVVKGID